MTTTTTEPGFSDAAIAALQQGNTIEAIKIVRTERGLGLKESKDAVDAYVREHPELQEALAASSAEAKRNLGRWLAILIGAGLIAWFVFRPR
jgi:ribosomal protein L7/L12